MLAPLSNFCPQTYVPIPTAGPARRDPIRRPSPTITQQPQPRALPVAPVSDGAAPSAAPRPGAPAMLPAPQNAQQGLPPWCLALWGYGQSVWQQVGELAHQFALQQADGSALHPYTHAVALGTSFGLPPPMPTGDSAPALQPGPQRLPRSRPLPQTAWPRYDRLPPLAQQDLSDPSLICCLTLEGLAELKQPVAVKHRMAVQLYEFEELKTFWRRNPKRIGQTPSYMPAETLYRVVRQGDLAPALP